MMRSPFISHDGRWYLVPTFWQRPSKALLLQTLEALLERHAPRDILILRPMSPAEVKLLLRYRRDFDGEAFAFIGANEDKRLGRSRRPTARRGRGEP